LGHRHTIQLVEWLLVLLPLLWLQRWHTKLVRIVHLHSIVNVLKPRVKPRANSDIKLNRLSMSSININTKEYVFYTVSPRSGDMSIFELYFILNKIGLLSLYSLQ